jgi:hypothetical protein
VHIIIRSHLKNFEIVVVVLKKLEKRDACERFNFFYDRMLLKTLRLAKSIAFHIKFKKHYNSHLKNLNKRINNSDVKRHLMNFLETS